MSAELIVIDSKPLTEMQDRYAYGRSCGLGPTQAATIVGYANPSVQGARHERDPRIRAAVKAYRDRHIDKLASLSVRELGIILKDRKISPAVRLKAITFTLSLAGHVPKGFETDDDTLRGKPVAEMTLAELDAFIAKEKAKRADGAKPVLDAEASGVDTADWWQPGGDGAPGAVIEGEAVALDLAEDPAAAEDPGLGAANPPPGVPRRDRAHSCRPVRSESANFFKTTAYFSPHLWGVGGYRLCTMQSVSPCAQGVPRRASTRGERAVSMSGSLPVACISPPG